MKKGFTLVEMLIVVVVLVTLMSIAFRLSSLGEDQTRRSITISRLQRLENCLSGFYAAYGTYPPVQLHGSRDYNLRVDQYTGSQLYPEQEEPVRFNWYKPTGDHGIQPDNKGSPDFEDWKKVRAACMAQPLAARFPYKGDRQKLIGFLNQSGTPPDPLYDDGPVSHLGRFTAYRDETDWRRIQIFQFGVFSYILPRYFLMLNGQDNAGALYGGFAQWTANNQLPADQMGTGDLFGNGNPQTGWADLNRYVKNASRSSQRDRNWASIAYIPSQAACARWLANLEGVCSLDQGVDSSYYGINIRDTDERKFSRVNYANGMGVFSCGGGGAGGSFHGLGYATMIDGWGNEFFYYSLEPHQNYVIWSAGRNQRTFPPWVPRDELPNSMARQCVGAWTEDDIVHMSN